MLWMLVRTRNLPIRHGVNGNLGIFPRVDRSLPAQLVALEDFLPLLGRSIYQIRIHFVGFSLRSDFTILFHYWTVEHKS